MFLAFRHLRLQGNLLHLHTSRHDHHNRFFAGNALGLGSGHDWCVEYHDTRALLVEKLDVERHGANVGDRHHRLSTVEGIIEFSYSPVEMSLKIKAENGMLG
jgi:hypothetical protein